MIKLEKLNKVYKIDDYEVHAVKDVTLDILNGDIHGIAGYSGAGKSTLVRLINLLERPDSGEIYIDNLNLIELDEKELRSYRKNIGMIFQNFNLFNLRTVRENIAFPLQKSDLSKKEIDFRVEELLKLVELEDKKDSYPSSLSGGQKQRVAIARALANNPKILLCDEATSALDPRTTKSILELLKKVNQELGITIVIITHQMEVIKEICDKVSIMKDGEIITTEKVIDIFADNENEEINEFLNNDIKMLELNNILNSKVFNLNEVNRILKINYKGRNTEKAIISEASRKFNIDISILFGSVEIVNDTPFGELIIAITGNMEKIIKAEEYFLENKLRVEEIEYGVIK